MLTKYSLLLNVQNYFYSVCAHTPPPPHIDYTQKVNRNTYLKKLVSKYLRGNEIKYKTLVEIHFFKVGLSIQYHFQIAMYQ